MRFSAVVLVAVLGSALVSSLAHAERETPGQKASFRVGSSARIALLPVKCARDMDSALCAAIDESLAVDLARETRLDILAPRDLEVLLGAQQLVELSNCDGDACFDASSFTQVEANYMMSTSIGRIGGDAMITIRLVDLKRGVVIDRDDARAWRSSEAGIDEATRALAHTILVRRGLASMPVTEEADEEGGSPLVFWGGAGVTGLGVVGVGAAGVLGTLAFVEASALRRSTGLTQANFDVGSQNATQLAFGADVALVAGGALVVGGVAMMILGSF